MSVPGVASPAADRFYWPPPRRNLLEKPRHQPSDAAPEHPVKPPQELRLDQPGEATMTNLESFIASIAVRVPARRHPQTRTRGRPTGAAYYYDLADLWEAFGEWSAYGAGVPLLLNGTDVVVQYYVPFLSAIQLYASSPLSPAASKCESGNQESCVVFQYMEHDAPYRRQPLADMISVFTSNFPDLKTYRSCDLQPSSWISVAWYPIYRIPTGPTLQDLDTCFLTFHSLSTEPDGTSSGRLETTNFNSNISDDVPGKITLPLIGLASYKLNGSMWISNKHHVQQLTTSLLKAADDWLCQRQVYHPDYRFFLSH